MRRLLQLLVALSLTVASLVPSLSGAPTARGAGLVIQRLAQAGRYATAASLSRSAFAPGIEVAFVTGGSRFAEGMAAGPLAAKRGGPILLTHRDRLPSATAGELTRLHPQRIVVVGGPAIVSDSIAARLASLATSGTVTRLGGNGRYATSAALSREAFAAGRSVAYVASGTSYRAAVSGSTAAAFKGAPLLLTKRDALPAPVKTELQRLAPDRIVILGGSGEVGEAVETDLATLAPRIRRIAGGNRYTTGAAISRATFGSGTPNLFLARGDTFTDALAVAPIAARAGSPLLLVRGDRSGAAALTEARRLAPGRLSLVGSTPGLSERVTYELRRALGDLAPLPVCRYDDVRTRFTDYGDWRITLLDTMFRVGRGYSPPRLIDSSRVGLRANHPFRRLVRDDLQAMARAAADAGKPIDIQSAYRSFTTQRATFQHWVDRVGYDEALRTSARPGHSEHQLGTTFDFMSRGAPDPWDRGDWARTAAGAWMQRNAWRYGFVMSYPKGSFGAVCYDYEPWHYRYYGRARAERMHDSGLLPREYLWLHADGKPA